MPLQKGTVSLTLASSISQRADDKQIDQTKLAVSEDLRVVKELEVLKRDGLQDYSTAQTSLTGTNPILIGASDSQNWTEDFDTKTLLHNKGAFYQRDMVANSWSQLAYAANLQVETKVTAASSYSLSYQSSVSAFGYTVTVSSDSSVVRLSVVRDSDGLVIRKDSVIHSSGSTNFESPVKVVPMNGTFAVLYVDVTLRGVVLTPSTGVLSAPVVVSGGSGVNSFDAVWVPGSARGDRLALLISQANTNLRLVDSSLTLDGTIGVQTVPTSAQVASLFNSVATGVNRLFGYAGSFNTVSRFIYDIGPAAWVVTAAPATAITLTFRNPYNNTAMAFLGLTSQIDAQDATKINVWVSYRDRSTGVEAAKVVADDIVTMVYTHDLSGTATTAPSVWSYGTAVAGRPFNDANRQTSLMPVIFYQGSSGFIGVCDFHRSRVARRPYLVARFGEGQADNRVTSTSILNTIPQRAFVMSETWATADGFGFGYISVNRYINIDEGVAEIGASVALVQIQGTKATVFQNNRNLIIGGAQAFSYDGADFGEFGFSFKPQKPAVSLGVGISVVIVTQGDASNPESTRFTFTNAANIAPSAYFTFTTTLTAAYVWYNFGGNPDPAPGGVGRAVLISADDTAADVAAKTAAALAASPVVGATSALEGVSSVRITNTVNGAVTDGTTNATDTPAVPFATPFAIGTYQFVAVNRYVDRWGKVWRSRPSDIATIAITATAQLFSAVIPTPDLTNRAYSLNEVEVYATEANGSVFHLLGTQSSSSKIPWNGTGPRLVFQNRTPLEPIFFIPYGANEQLYTTGDVLENDYPTGWNMTTTYKGRRALGFPKSQRLVYSKTAAEDEGLAFSDLLQILADQDDDYIGAIGELDDKLIIFKRTSKKYVVVGEPANDAGSGSSLSLPTLLSGDTGCNEPLSLVQNMAGLFYRSDRKGIYLLGRDLSDKYVGVDVQNTNGFTLARAGQVATGNEIMFTFRDSPLALSYNYDFGIWAYWKNHLSEYWSGSGRVTIVRANGRVLYQVPGQAVDIEDSVSTPVIRMIELPWLKAKGQQDFQRVYQFEVLGKYLSPHSMQIDLWWDYDQRDAVKQTLVISSADIMSGVNYADGTYQFEVQPMIQKCEAIKIRLTDIPNSVLDARSCTLNSIDFEVGMKKGQNKMKEGKKV